VITTTRPDPEPVLTGVLLSSRGGYGVRAIN
jgi:hypothetical protein